MQQYLDLLRDILKNGTRSANRTGVETIKVFDRTMRFDLREGFPILTTKKIHFKSVVAELLWFLSGSTNNNDLLKDKVTIWNEWATESGSLGQIYGQQWRRFPAGQYFRTLSDEQLNTYLAELDPIEWEHMERDAVLNNIDEPRDILSWWGIDQISQTISLLRKEPDSRRIIVTAWNPAVVPLSAQTPQENVVHGRAALPACHTFFQFVTEEMDIKERLRWYMAHGGDYIDVDDDAAYISDQLDNRDVPRRYLSCSVNCRSQDCFLGTPFNVSSYALLTHLIADEVNMAPKELVWHGIDCHIYTNHLNQVNEQLSRDPRELPTLKFTPHKGLFNYTLDDISLVGYSPLPAIKAPVAV